MSVFILFGTSSCSLDIDVLERQKLPGLWDVITQHWVRVEERDAGALFVVVL